jgi:putative flippase GtrA
MKSLALGLNRRFGGVPLQFLKFGLVGIAGLGVDTLVYYLGFYGAGLPPYQARLVSYLFGATTTWALNRSYTFKGADSDSLWRQWARFVAVNAVGGAVNYIVSVTLISTSPFIHAHPFLALGAGAIAGMFLNFASSKRLVFKGA